jgi:hypothetical protein
MRMVLLCRFLGAVVDAPVARTRGRGAHVLQVMCFERVGLGHLEKVKEKT